MSRRRDKKKQWRRMRNVSRKEKLTRVESPVETLNEVEIKKLFEKVVK